MIPRPRRTTEPPITIAISIKPFRVLETHAEVHFIPLQDDDEFVFVLNKQTKTWNRYQKHLYVRK